MTTQLAAPNKSLSQKQQRRSVLPVFVMCAIALGTILGTSALIIWPISAIEGWNSDRPITIMLGGAFFLLFAACHYLDRDEERKRLDLGKSL